MVRMRALEKLYFPLVVTAAYGGLVFLVCSVYVGSFVHAAPVPAAEPTRQLPKPEKKVTSGRPVRVIVPSVSIDLPVTDGVYNTRSGTWTIGNYQAYYATPTPPLNDSSGTTLIYGHNNRTAFRKLQDVEAGAELMVYTGTGTVFRYSLTEAHEVQPSDTNILSYDGPPMVILQTCSGNWNEYRKLYMFKFESVERQADQ